MERVRIATIALMASVLCAGATPAFAQTSPEASTAATADFDDSILNAKKNMMSDPSAALSHARAAEDLARATPFSEAQSLSIATAYWLQAEALNRLNRPNEAEPIVQRALGLIGPERMNTKLGADLILSRGRIARVLRNDQIALESFHQAHDIFAELGATRYQAISLQSLGSIYQDARDYQRVLEFYSRASSIHQNDPALDLASYNNQASAQRELGRYTDSILLSEKALAVAKEFDSPILTARVISNIASTHVMSGNFPKALERIEEALTLLEGIDSGEWRPVMQGVKAQALAGLGEKKPAAAIFDHLFRQESSETTTAPFRDIHEAAYYTYKDLDRTADALIHLEAFKRIDDSARDLAASANNVLTAAQFDFASQELSIAKLNAKRLEDEIALRKAGLRQRTLLFGAAFGFGALIAIALGWGLISARRGRKRIELANQKLEETNTELGKANQVKTEFLATTSHEIRTPLNGILGMTQVMLNQDEVNPTQREQLESIWSAGDTLLAIVNDILDVSTIETGRFRIVKDVTNLPKLTNQVAEIFRDTAQAKGVQLTIDTGTCPEAIVTDAMRIRQVLFNLVSNAVKFTAEGRVHVALSVKPMGTEEGLSILVSDTGIGIPDTELESVFEAFHQVDSGRTRKFGGTGLGLSICKHIAEALGGKIAITSMLGEGTRFEVLVPLERPQTSRVEATSDNLQLARTCVSQLDVLVVEDNLLNRNVIKALIDKQVKSVTLVEDGVQAVSAVKQAHYDVILMDKQMPNMDGITATKTIRNMMDGREDTYIIAVTADAYEGAREELLEAGSDDYLSKPVNAEGLLKALQLAVERGVSHKATSPLAAA